MSKPRTSSNLIPDGHTADQVARRAAAIDKLLALLAEQQLTARDIAAHLAMKGPTVYGYLSQLRDEGFVRLTGHVDAHRRALWALDPMGTQANPTEHARRAWIVPARQIGMQRHWMDVALFGPAAGAAA